MKLSEIKKHLSELKTISFKLPNGELVPSHFHVTEVGKVSKHYIDCGGKVRKEEIISMQLWEENDYDHRLHPEKLLHIISLSEKIIGFDDLEIEVEYQSDTIGKFTLDFNGKEFLLVSTNTACLAKENCGIPAEKPRIRISDVQNNSCCDPTSGCC